MILLMQIQKLQEMKSDLWNFCSLMQNQMSGLHSNLLTYKQQGFPKEIADKYEQRHYATAKNTIDQMTSRINTLHMNYLDGVIADLTRAVNR